jgi:hypothetical protein
MAVLHTQSSASPLELRPGPPRTDNRLLHLSSCTDNVRLIVMKVTLLALCAVSFAFLHSTIAHAQPARIGQCVITSVSRVATRLADDANRLVPGSGSAIEFANGGYQVSYEQVRAVDRSRRGDRVRMCLVSIPENCPPGDERGRSYKVTNLRTRASWVLPDSEHACGGA